MKREIEFEIGMNAKFAPCVCVFVNGVHVMDMHHLEQTSTDKIFGEGEEHDPILVMKEITEAFQEYNKKRKKDNEQQHG